MTIIGTDSYDSEILPQKNISVGHNRRPERDVSIGGGNARISLVRATMCLSKTVHLAFKSRYRTFLFG